MKIYNNVSKYFKSEEKQKKSKSIGSYENITINIEDINDISKNIKKEKSFLEQLLERKQKFEQQKQDMQIRGAKHLIDLNNSN